MNKKVVSLIAVALVAYGIFVALVVTFYDDSPTNMGWEDRESFNKQYVSKVKLDQLTFDKVILDLGSPDITEAKKVDSNQYQLTYYRTQHVKSDGITTEEECTALLFKNSILNAVGRSAIEAYNSLK
ncbi:MAG: hypothetical protein COB35_10975 [Gammaproteobacteria bacterium]|nr:MAG: hypothetical protein COB35_10975 [Gammaproteobacteria bacterium]